MAKFEVVLKEIEIYQLEVEADNEEAALEKAYKEIETEKGKQMYHHDSDGESEIYEI